MAESGLNTIGRWATTAICAAAMSLAYAQPVAASMTFRPPTDHFPATFLVARPALASQRPPGSWLVSPGVFAPRGLIRHRLPMPSLTAGYRPVSGDARRVPPPSGDAVSVRAGSI